MTCSALVVAVAMLALFAAHARVSAQLVLEPPVITHAAADNALQSLHITGTSFGTTMPIVRAADVSLVVTTFSATDIVAEMAPAGAPGVDWHVRPRFGSMPAVAQVCDSPSKVELAD